MIWLLGVFVVIFVLVYLKISLRITTLVLTTLLAVYSQQTSINQFVLWLWMILFIVFIPLNTPAIRRPLLSLWIFKAMRNAMPAMSQTEREALEAGNVWWDAELFSGTPNWKVLQDLPAAKLSPEEKAFIDGPVETLCRMLDDWEITHKHKDLPPEVWDFIKTNKFCGMIIPKQYGGLDFSHFAHSEVVMKIASRSSSAAVTVMVPNSLGPAKLLLSYGTQAQKDHYLPRLVNGTEVPCFALTGPHAGSDASAMPDTGIVCYGKFKHEEHVLGIRLNWEKRYITLGPVATILGLAFKLYDPDKLIGDKENIGITVALIPTNTEGVSIGKRHFPLDSAFQNGPNWGNDVFIPMDWIIGGVDQVGNGWKMLMQSLSTGRGISLPALSTAAAKFACRNTGAYARIRKQFNVPICEFEGIKEPLARMAGEAYILDAARKVTAAALDQGEQPSVISAIIKYEMTERMRRVINDGMDIQGGSGICLGPSNYLGRLYQVIPVSITVEGANILTRTMMIFGQGAVRCHPFIQQEMDALYAEDSRLGLQQFDNILFRHLGQVLHNVIASIWLALTRSCLISTPGNNYSKKYYRQISRLSVGFALLADYGLLMLGGSLKRKEHISGCFADALSNLYLCSTVLKHYHNQGCPVSDQPLLDWACQQTLYQSQQALQALLLKLPYKPLLWILKALIFPAGSYITPPADDLIDRTAEVLLDDQDSRDRLTDGIYINHIENDPTGRIEIAFQAVLKAAPVESKIRKAQKLKQLNNGNITEILKQALQKNILSPQDVLLIENAEKARLAAVTVDAFEPEQLINA